MPYWVLNDDYYLDKVLRKKLLLRTNVWLGGSELQILLVSRLMACSFMSNWFSGYWFGSNCDCLLLGHPFVFSWSVLFVLFVRVAVGASTASRSHGIIYPSGPRLPADSPCLLVDPLVVLHLAVAVWGTNLSINIVMTFNNLEHAPLLASILQMSNLFLKVLDTCYIIHL